ncbi:hypothetical protein WISP_07391 [Willisornis vidua]|uniref:Uncharacterized protein n=1 Tax=Willisornis vidua TaxID=1566151 RepID=A0ABQ9DT85_9PASS|nr:hypothetical protein WISP_07391 [Willisornis vidua]
MPFVFAVSIKAGAHPKAQHGVHSPPFTQTTETGAVGQLIGRRIDPQDVAKTLKDPTPEFQQELVYENHRVIEVGRDISSSSRRAGQIQQLIQECVQILSPIPSLDSLQEVHVFFFVLRSQNWSQHSKCGLTSDEQVEFQKIHLTCLILTKNCEKCPSRFTKTL